jgi:hypothetical protein
MNFDFNNPESLIKLCREAKPNALITIPATMLLSLITNDNDINAAVVLIEQELGNQVAWQIGKIINPQHYFGVGLYIKLKGVADIGKKIEIWQKSNPSLPLIEEAKLAISRYQAQLQYIKETEG